MANISDSSNAGIRLCNALGIDAANVRKIVVTYDPHSIVTAEVMLTEEASKAVEDLVIADKPEVIFK